MNILLINHYAGAPKLGMAFRPYYLAAEWIKMGHNITILCADYSHLRNTNPQYNNDFYEEFIDNIRYVWVKTSKYKGNGIGRIKNIAQFVWKTFFNVKKIIRKYKPDVVIASSTYPSDNYIAKRIAKFSGSKYIFEVHDLWPLSPMELGKMSKYHPFIMFMQHGENFAYRNADAVVSMLPETQDHMISHGLDILKWNYIPNGIVIDKWNSKSKIPLKYSQILLDIKEKEKKIVGYAGGHASSNALLTMINAAKLMINENVVFVLVGNGVEKQKLVEEAKNFNNIYFFDSIIKESIPDLLSYFDFGIIGSIDSPLYRFGISPNKLFDYMISELPVIQYINAGNDIVQESKCGLSVQPGNPQAIADAVKLLINMPQDKLNQMGTNGKEYVLNNHDYKVLAQNFIDIINKGV